MLFCIVWSIVLTGMLCISENRLLASGKGSYISLANAKIVISPESPVLNEIAVFLRNEIETRTGIMLDISSSPEPDNFPVIVLGTDDENPVPPAGLSVPAKKESYAIWIDQTRNAPLIYLSGRDERGVLFAAGRLLRLMLLSDNYISIPENTKIASAPADEIRAQQIISNTQCEDRFVNWKDEKDVQQFVRDMVIFGANGFEPTVPELVDEYLESLDMELFIKLKCQEIIDYDLESDTTLLNMYNHLTGIDHITTYGGDASGAVKPQLFFPHMERVLPLILKGQPGVKWWYSNQCLEDHAKDEDEYIFGYINEKKPSWLYGMVYGPWTKRGIPDIREDLPERYVIRHFPEICHPRWCQYPVPGWDRIFSIVWPRNQSIYAMPSMMLDIYRAARNYTAGALPYNHTGTYNDLNKFVWAMAGWDPEIAVEEILHDYARMFFAYDFKKIPGRTMDNTDKGTPDLLVTEGTEAVMKGLMLLEKNWSVPLNENQSAEAALDQWKLIADCMGGPAINWRVEMFLYKARIDAQIKRKHDLERELEREAYEILFRAGKNGIQQSIDEALLKLAEIDTRFQSADEFRTELSTLGLTGRFGDIDQIIENIYTPFNDRLWIEDQLKNAQTPDDIDAILHYEDPGEGGFYDNLGVRGEQPHLVRQKTWTQDPGFVHSPVEWVDNISNSSLRHSQLTHAFCRYDTPLTMRWEGLDKEASYKIKVVYNGPFDIDIKCETDDHMIIHDFIKKTGSEPMEFAIPAKSTQDGNLILTWKQDAVNNIYRGVSVSEIWLMRMNK